MSTVFIDPTATSAGDGSFAHPYSSWSGISLSAGNTYLQKAGTTEQAELYLDSTGTADSQTIIGAYGNGAAPVIQGGVDVAGASYATIEGLTVEGGGAAIGLQQGANHINIINDTLINSLVGLWIGNGAGGDNLVAGNTVQNNSINGIAVDQVANAAGHATFLVGNTVTGNGAHGIDVDGNNFVVQGNIASNNGLTFAGASGIHISGGSDGSPDGFGIGNQIVSNVTNGNHDNTTTDGNGIELDQYTNNNIVYGNSSQGNDGAGIVLYDSYSNVIAGNYMAGNEQDPSGTHEDKGELSLDAGVGMTGNNVVIGNVAVAMGNSPAIFIDGQAALTPGLFISNFWMNMAGAVASNDPEVTSDIG